MNDITNEIMNVDNDNGNMFKNNENGGNMFENNKITNVKHNQTISVISDIEKSMEELNLNCHNKRVKVSEEMNAPKHKKRKIILENNNKNKNEKKSEETNDKNNHAKQL